MPRMVYLLTLFWGLFLFSTISNSQTPLDPLPSWNAGPIKQNLIRFVQETIDNQSPHYVLPEDRIATFDNDGTLWVEQPIYTQVIFAMDRLRATAPQHPEWKQQDPFKSILNHHYEYLTVQDIEKVIAATHSGMTVDEFRKIETDWLATATDKRFKRHYTQLVYQPMLEVIRFLQENNFKVYIVTGGGQDFVRSFSPKVYGIPVEQVIGSAGKTKYVYQNSSPELIKTAEVLLIDDYQGKPEGINLLIGKKPIIAFGNSDGDRQMLEWTQSGKGQKLMLLVHHDDAQREYAYDVKSKVGTFSEALMQEANKNAWQVISMKKDWKVIFPH